MTSAAKIKDHYSTLGVPRTATQEEIKAKYRTLVLKYHPDVNTTDKDAEAKFLNLQEAFDVIGDEYSRQAYDEEVRVASAPSFRGEPWPTRKHKYARQSPQGTTRASPRPSDFQTPYGTTAPKYNIAEWERAHYGIGNPPHPSHGSASWPTGEKDDHMSNHQLYFKYRAERLRRGGGHLWAAKKFSTVSFLMILRRNA